MKKYICDEVVLDTKKGLQGLRLEYPELTDEEFLKILDWEDWLEQAEEINHSLDLLRYYYQGDTDLLVPVNTLQEAVAKITYYRSKKLANNIVVVPKGIKMNQIVDPFNKVLVGHTISNLDDWNRVYGIPFYFGNQDSIYESITSLEEVLDPMKLEKRLSNYKSVYQNNWK